MIFVDGPSSSFEDRRRKESSTEFPNQQPKNLGERDKLYWNIPMNVDLKEEKPPDFGCFLSTHGLFSIKIKVSFKAEISLRSKRFRLVSEQRKTSGSRFWPREK